MHEQRLAPGEMVDGRIPELSLVMPAYNEEQALPVSVAEAVAALQMSVQRWELVVVDDGSTDNTPPILAEWAVRDARIRVITNPQNIGYSKALVRGFAACRLAAVAYTDADAQFDLGEISRLYPRLAEADMVAGYRVDRQDPWLRRFASTVYNLLQNLLLGRWVRDVNCALKLFRRDFFDRVEMSSDGFLIDAELYARASHAGLSWVQEPVTHRPRTQGSSSVKVDSVRETLLELWRLRRSLS